jgi:hypothetical protein
MERHDSHFFVVSKVDWDCANCGCGWHDAASTKPCPNNTQLADQSSTKDIDWFSLNAGAG